MLAWVATFARIATETTLSPEAIDYRRGYLITLAGLTITLGTVYIWNATSVFVWIYLGAGAWFYMQDRSDGREELAARARRAAQARIVRPSRPGHAPASCTCNRGSTGKVIETYRKLLDLLTPRERRIFYLLIGMIVVMGLVEMLGVASILPLMFVLRRPEVIETNAWLSWIYHGLGFSSHQGFMVFLALAVFGIVVFGMVFKAVTSYATYHFAMLRGYTISSRMLNGYLFQPYTWFLNRHSAGLGAAVLGEVQKVVACPCCRR